MKTSPVVPPAIRELLGNQALAGLLSGHLRSLSPIHKVRGDAPPFLLIHGTADNVVPYSQALKMHEKMRAAGANCELMTVEGGGHGMRLWDRSPRQSVYRERMIAWLRAKMAA